MDPDSLSPHLIPFKLGSAIEDEHGQDNLELQAGDIITIFSQADLRVPVRRQSTYVYLEGEFNRAGVYKARPGETLKQLVQRVGGFTPQAYLYGAEFTRQSIRQQQQKGLREMVRQEQEELQRQSNLMLAKATTTDDITALRFTMENQRAALTRMGHIEPTGRIVLNLQPGDSGIDSLSDIVLEDGDRFFVPYRSSSVNVMGQVYNSGTFLYDPHKTVRDYLRQAGGGTRDADRGKVFVLRANGSVVGKNSHSNWWMNSFESLRLMPGDTLVLPLKVPHDGVGRQLKDWGQIFSQFALGAAAIRVLKNQ
jgi:protein involved in polysaccharide export with SLBB domain